MLTPDESSHPFEPHEESGGDRLIRQAAFLGFCGLLVLSAIAVIAVISQAIRY